MDADGRTCTKCQTWKTWDHFHINNRAASGFQAKCKQCQIKAVQQTADREKAKAYAAQYYQKRKRPSTNMMSR